MTPSPSVLLRPAHAGDAVALTRLAALDSADPLSGPVLVAETGGRVEAALDRRTGAVVADPFARTAPLVELLRLAALASAPPRRGRARRRPALRIA